MKNMNYENHGLILQVGLVVGLFIAIAMCISLQLSSCRILAAAERARGRAVAQIGQKRDEVTAELEKHRAVEVEKRREIDGSLEEKRDSVARVKRELKYVSDLNAGQAHESAPIHAFQHESPLMLALKSSRYLESVRVAGDEVVFSYHYTNISRYKDGKAISASPDVEVNFFDRNGQFKFAVRDKWRFWSLDPGEEKIEVKKLTPEQCLSVQKGEVVYYTIKDYWHMDHGDY